MFEIGPALREARERRGISYAQVEADIAIRSRYVRALEEEDFGILPGPVYTKGFLRAYAEYLNLDGQLFVDEFNSRHHDPRREYEQPIASKPRSRPQQRRHRRESQLVMIALAAIVAVTSIIFLVGLKRGPDVATIPPPTTTNHQTTGPGTTTQGSTGTTQSTTQKHKAKKPAKKQFTVVLTATARCWIVVRKSSGSPVLSTSNQDLSGYMIDPAISSTVTFVAKAPVLISQIGAPSALSITVDGKAAPLPAGTSNATTLKVSSTGVATA